MLIRVEEQRDVEPIRQVTAAAFRNVDHAAPEVDGAPGEAALVGWLRDDAGWIPGLSFVAEIDQAVVGHVVATRGYVGDWPALGLGPVSVHPDHQGTGIGSALVYELLAKADRQGDTLVALLGAPGYYQRFGFRTSTYFQVDPPNPEWGDFFQALTLTAHDPMMAGTFRYADPFNRLG